MYVSTSSCHLPLSELEAFRSSPPPPPPPPPALSCPISCVNWGAKETWLAGVVVVVVIETWLAGVVVTSSSSAASSSKPPFPFPPGSCLLCSFAYCRLMMWFEFFPVILLKKSNYICRFSLKKCLLPYLRLVGVLRGANRSSCTRESSVDKWWNKMIYQLVWWGCVKWSAFVVWCTT